MKAKTVLQQPFLFAIDDNCSNSGF